MAVKENWADGNVLYSADLNPLGVQINENEENLDVVQVNLNEALVDIIQLQADATITPATHSASVADIFSDSTGYNDTIASDTNCTYNADLDVYSADSSEFVAGDNLDSDSFTGSDNDAWDTAVWDTAKLGTDTGTAKIQGNQGRLNCQATTNTVGVYAVTDTTWDLDAIDEEMIRMRITWDDLVYGGNFSGNFTIVFGLRNTVAVPTTDASALDLAIYMGRSGASFNSVKVFGNSNVDTATATGSVIDFYVKKKTATSVYYRVDDDGVMIASGVADVTNLLFKGTCRAYLSSGGTTEVSSIDFDNMSIDEYSPSITSFVQTESLVSSNATNVTDTWTTLKDDNGDFITGTYSASSDGGSNYTDDLALNEKANITSTQGDELKLKLNITNINGITAFSTAWWD